MTYSRITLYLIYHNTIRYSMMSWCHSNNKIWSHLNCLIYNKYRIWMKIKEDRWYPIWRENCKIYWLIMTDWLSIISKIISTILWIDTHKSNPSWIMICHNSVRLSNHHNIITFRCKWLNNHNIVRIIINNSLYSNRPLNKIKHPRITQWFKL